MKIKKQKGFGLMELVVGLGIISVAFFALLSVSNNTLELSRRAEYSLGADFLLEEGIEALRFVRDRGWTSFIVPLTGTNYLAFDTGISKWTTTPTPEIIDGIFTRSFEVRDVFRDSNQDIADLGTLDPNTKKFTVNVSWQSSGTTTSRSVSAYLTNYFND